MCGSNFFEQELTNTLFLGAKPPLQITMCTVCPYPFIWFFALEVGSLTLDASNFFLL